ncbi:hypothetical protein HDR66_00860 [bacterium]|nr:hypothetical protein [bacterium]
MKKIAILLCVMTLGACTFPTTPQDGDLMNATHQFQPELFTSGARGVAIVSMSDNVSDTGWFGKNYTNGLAFKNTQSGEAFFLSTKKGSNDYDTAMLTVGEYEVTNLYMQYVYTTTSQVGNTTIVTTHVDTDDHFEGDKKIRFTVRPGVVTYIGHIDLVRAENVVSSDGVKKPNSFNISDKSADIPERQIKKWKQKFGTDYAVNVATVQ